MTAYADVIPGIGISEKDLPVIAKQITQVSPYVDWIQIDIADGKLVPNTTNLDPKPFREMIANSTASFELHMMIESPFKIAQSWIDVGFKRLLFHIEGLTGVMNNESGIMEELTKIQNQGIEVGLVVDKQTPIDTLYPYLDTIDCVLVMTIAAGFSGQKFIPEMLEKVRDLKTKAPDMPVEVDGGVTFETAKLSVAAGVTRLVSTSTLFNAVNLQEAIERMKQAI